MLQWLGVLSTEITVPDSGSMNLDWVPYAIGSILLVTGVVFLKRIAEMIVSNPKIMFVLLVTIAVLVAIVIGALQT